MPNVRQFNKSKYVKKEDCDPQIIVTIKGSRAENMAWAGEPEDMKWVLEFQEDVKDFVISNLINQDSLVQITGTEDLNKWIGTKIILYVNPDIEHKGKRVGGIRVKESKTPPANEPLTIEEQRRRLAEAEKAEAEKAKTSPDDDTDEYGNPIPF